jgi:hypothetical protein
VALCAGLLAARFAAPVRVAPFAAFLAGFRFAGRFGAFFFPARRGFARAFAAFLAPFAPRFAPFPKYRSIGAK